ncbi:MAG: ROK family protein [Thermoplasmata archaeon]|nr:ROK family protein [Thermoplasmata archaeon]
MDRPTLGVDLGGTKVETAVVAPNGHIISSRRRPTDASRGPDAVISDLLSILREALASDGRDAKAVGIGVAAQVDGQGEVLFAPNLNWRHVPLGPRLSKELGIPVVVTNDVRAATYGEWQYGAGRGERDLVCMFIGTGIGGGAVVAGTLLEGASFTGGELGHMTIVAGGRPCRCRNQGCLEAYAGGWAIEARAQEAAKADPPAGQWLTRTAGSSDAITAATVTEGYGVGDALSRRLLDETATYLGVGLVGVVNAFNPRRVILGGGVIERAPFLLEPVEHHVRSHALEAALGELAFERAGLGNDAGVVGAAALARRPPAPGASP